MCQDNKVEAKRNRCGKRRRITRRRRSLSINRREILQTRWGFGQLRGYCKESVGSWKAGSCNKGTQVPVFPVRVLTEVGFLQLLDHEQHASDQVPLLLSMKEDRLALIKAVDSGDTDLGERISCSHLKIVNRTTSLPCLAPLA